MSKTAAVYIALHLLGFAGICASLLALRGGHGPGALLGAAGGTWLAACIIAARVYVISRSRLVTGEKE